jgi:hypothetical protein
MNIELIKKKRVGRLVRVSGPSGEFLVEYDGSGNGFESVLVNGEVVARAWSRVRMVPHFSFPVGPYAGVITIRTKLWRDLLGPILGRLEAFRLELDGRVVYED